MSEENIELTAAVVDAVAHQDLPRLIELTDPEVEWHSLFAQLGQRGVYRGHDGMRQYVTDLNDAWDFLKTEDTQAIAVGDLVLLVGQLRYRGKGSGVEAVSSTGYVVKFRKGRVLYMRAFRDPEQALEAAGLSE
jgi:ketosteroid isomerase-like protein